MFGARLRRLSWLRFFFIECRISRVWKQFSQSFSWVIEVNVIGTIFSGQAKATTNDTTTGGNCRQTSLGTGDVRYMYRHFPRLQQPMGNVYILFFCPTRQVASPPPYIAFAAS